MESKVLEHRVDTLEKRINSYSERLDKTERDGVKRDIQIENICKNIEGLINTLKWAMGFVLTGTVGFFFYLIQNHFFS